MRRRNLVTRPLALPRARRSLVKSALTCVSWVSFCGPGAVGCLVEFESLLLELSMVKAPCREMTCNYSFIPRDISPGKENQSTTTTQIGKKKKHQKPFSVQTVPSPIPSKNLPRTKLMWQYFPHSRNRIKYELQVKPQ